MGPDPKLVIVVAAVLIDGDDKVLLAQRPEGKAMAGLWEFPGGKLEDGETPEAALARELREELGIAVAQQNFVPWTFASHSYEDFHLLMPLYLCRCWQGSPQPYEHQALAWVSVDQLERYPMPPADEPLVQALKALL